MAQKGRTPPPLPVRTIQVLVLGENVNVTYRPGRMTPTNGDEWEAQRNHPDPQIAAGFYTIAMAESVIESWDLKLHGVAVPLTNQGFLEMPFNILKLIMQNVFEDFKKRGQPRFTPSSAA